MPTFKEMMAARVAAGKYLCIGLDPDLSKIPSCVPGDTDAERVYSFLFETIENTHEVALAYKPQSAFFEALSKDGAWVLPAIVQRIRDVAPGVPIILDWKRGDILNTNNGYITAAYDQLGVDAVTLHPYLGLEAMAPFVNRPGAMSIVLCRTSNKGAGEFQDVECTVWRHEPSGEYFANVSHAKFEKVVADGEESTLVPETMKLFEYVALRVAHTWSKHGDCAVVVGATWADELKLVREIVGDLVILVPGLGTQGGTVEDVIPGALDANGFGIIPNNASAINFAFDKVTKDGGGKMFTPEQWGEASGYAAVQANNALANRLALAV